MCEFCSKHKRKKWFLDSDNYSEQMLKNKTRKNVLQRISRGWDFYMRDTKKLIDFDKIPLFDPIVRPVFNKLIKYEHAGQVVNVNDALEILELADNHVVFECACRKLVGLESKSCCINFGPMKDLSLGLEEKPEEVDVPELKLRLNDWFSEGLFPQVLYATAPFPIAMCVCERKYCVPAKLRSIYNFPAALLKGHEVGIVDNDACRGCPENCMPVCPFGAMYMDQINNKVVIDPLRCYGCGLCKSRCPYKAISLFDRSTISSVKNKW